MERQLRLAERQGLLRGRLLGEVQTYALELLHYADRKLAGAKHVEEIRLALVASGMYQPQALLIAGEAVPRDRPVSAARPADAVVDYSMDPDAVEDYSEVAWESPSSSGEEEVEKDLRMFQQAMAANQSVSVSDDGGGEWL